MRADRLIALLMILQARGRVTAQALAEELEVSERTIYRDLDALGTAGVPVFAERGPGGGCSLLESYRTTLTGLTEPEARALFMLHVPQPLAALGVNRDLQNALRKLSAALPETRREAAATSRQRIHLDSTWWFQSAEPSLVLQTLYQAVWHDHRVRLTLHVGPPVDGPVTCEVAPYGLVAKASLWHLVCDRDGHLRVYATSEMLAAQELPAAFDRPDDFDLARFWTAWCADVERGRPSFTTQVRVAPDLWPKLTWYLGRDAAVPVAPCGDPGPGEWPRVQMTFGSFEEARARLLGLGGAVEVVEPLALRLSLADFAEQAAAVYACPKSRARSLAEG